MRFFVFFLACALICLQYRVWISENGMREVARLQAASDAQRRANLGQRERNRELSAEVADLKGGMRALEERARSDLGMVGNNETFYQVVSGGAAAPAAAASAAAASAAAQRAALAVPANTITARAR